jgi:hypothetical protein
MAVVPACAILRRLKGVRLGLAWSNGTFRYARNTILTVFVPLSQSMPMNGCTIVLHLVDNCHRYHITPVRVDRRSRVLPIDRKNLTRMTVRAHRLVRDCKGVADGLAGRRPTQVKLAIVKKSGTLVTLTSWCRSQCPENTGLASSSLKSGCLCKLVLAWALPMWWLK